MFRDLGVSGFLGFRVSRFLGFTFSRFWGLIFFRIRDFRVKISKTENSERNLETSKTSKP
jgi:hypothetical protein